MLVPGSSARPANILVQPLAVASGMPFLKPLAVDGTVVGACFHPNGNLQTVLHAAKRFLGAAAIAFEKNEQHCALQLPRDLLPVL